MRIFTFDGVDGTGKTTLISEIKQELTDRGFDVVSYKENYREDGNYDKQRKDILAHIVSNRYHHNTIILIDRSHLSTIIYQKKKTIRMPSIYDFVVIATPETIHRNILARGGMDEIELQYDLLQLQQEFLDIAQSEEFGDTTVIVDNDDYKGSEEVIKWILKTM